MGSGTKTVEKPKIKAREPEEFTVVLLNDDITTMEFVVHVLETVFHKSDAEAIRLMLEVHRKGRGAAGIYSYDIAVTKANQVHSLARQNNFPLRCVVEAK